MKDQKCFVITASNECIHSLVREQIEMWFLKDYRIAQITSCSHEKTGTSTTIVTTTVLLEKHPIQKNGKQATSVNQEILALPIDTLRLSIRAKSALKIGGVETLSDLVQKDCTELLGYRNFSVGSLCETIRALAEQGLYLGYTTN